MDQRISDDTVFDNTSRTWPEWFDLLEARGGADLSHKEIVAILRDSCRIESDWWCQCVASEYEKHIGRRETGSTADAGFQIGVQKTLPVDVPTAWELMTSAEGARHWLNVDEPAPNTPGQLVKSSDGHQYELRTITTNERIRLRRTDAKSGAESTVQMTLSPTTGGTRLNFHHEGLADADERERMREHWRKIAGKILGIV